MISINGKHFSLSAIFVYSQTICPLKREYVSAATPTASTMKSRMAARSVWTAKILQEYYNENTAFAEERAQGSEANGADNVLPSAKVEPCVTVKVVIMDGIASSVLASRQVEVEFISIDKDYEDYEALCQYEENLRNDETLREYDFTVAHFEENDK